MFFDASVKSSNAKPKPGANALGLLVFGFACILGAYVLRDILSPLDGASHLGTPVSVLWQ